MSTFEALANVGDQLSATTKRLERAAHIGAFLKGLPPDELELAACLLIGQVFPEGDPRILNLSGAAISRVIAGMAGGESVFAQAEGAVDFGDAIEKVLRQRGHARRGPPLSLFEVFHTYEELAAVSGSGSRTRKDILLHDLFARASPLEAKYIVKHLIREMRVGVNEGSLLDALARATGIPLATIRRAHQFTGDVGRVAYAAIVLGEPGVRQLESRVGQPLKPMLAQSATDIADALRTIPPGQVALEYKLDGARVQIHKQGEAVRIFSRSLADLTASLPEIVEEVRRQIGAAEAIVEGEAMALTPEGRPRPFQELMRRIGRERGLAAMQEKIPVRLYLFDCLYRNGELLIDYPNSARWQALAEICGQNLRVERIVPQTLEEGEAFLKRAQAAGHEGVMAKNLASPYTPGERGKHWLKVKPIITLDLVIVAAEWGYGRRTGWLSNVHLAARDQETGAWLEVGKTFKGFTDAEFKSLTERLLALKVKETRGVVWVRPEIVVEVAFNNVQFSPQYPSRAALRFARVLRIRDDKPASEADTIQTVRALRPESSAPAEVKSEG